MSVRAKQKPFPSANTCYCPGSPNLIQSSICSTRFYFLLFFIPIVITVVHEIIATFFDDSGNPYITPKVKQELPTFYLITFIQKDTMCHQGQKYQFITILKANIIFLFVVLRLKISLRLECEGWLLLREDTVKDYFFVP